VRLLGVAALIALATAAAAWSGSSPGDLQLLRRYAPIVVLHPSERFAPVPVDGFLADSDLVGGHYDNRRCRSIDGPSALDCYAQADAAHAARPTIYGAVFLTSARIALQYWLFYSFDLYSPTDPPGPFWQDHEGDWEAVTVLLSRDGSPLLAGTSRHCSGARRAWMRVHRRGTHPVVYVALGSHANFFSPGEGPLDVSCFPDVARRIYKAYGVTLRDHVAAGRTIAGVTVVRITDTTPSWMAFAGAWGEAQYVHFPENEPFAFEFGPRGPAFHRLWRQPVATVLSWPRE
jgi:hypothetical protein